jgi:hypothetical protein
MFEKTFGKIHEKIRRVSAGKRAGEAAGRNERADGRGGIMARFDELLKPVILALIFPMSMAMSARPVRGAIARCRFGPADSSGTVQART